jgi:hypothetical protein
VHICYSLVKESNDFPRYVASTGLFMVHNTGRCGEDDVLWLSVLKSSM